MESNDCNRFSCPEDCEVGEWGSWGDCSLTCGGVGTMTRSRSVTKEASNGGASCGNLAEESDCNEGACPVHCEVGQWGQYDDCTLSCGSGGTQTRTRSIIEHAAHGGYTCPDLSMEAPCNEVCCPTDCVVGAWGDWSSFVGGGNNLERTRSATTESACGGAECPSLRETKEYTDTTCGNTYKSKPSICSKTCGGGFMKVRHEHVRCGGAPVKFKLAYTRYTPCNQQDCTTEEEWNQPHLPLPEPEIEYENTALEEVIGSWSPITKEDMELNNLSHEHGMMKFVPSQ